VLWKKSPSPLWKKGNIGPNTKTGGINSTKNAIVIVMREYNPDNKELSRKLRKNITPEEQIIWKYIRRKQIHDVQFYRQKPLGEYIVDFYCPRANLVLEIDGIQHIENAEYDAERDYYLEGLGLRVVRIWNSDVRNNLKNVLKTIRQIVQERISAEK